MIVISSRRKFQVVTTYETFQITSPYTSAKCKYLLRIKSSRRYPQIFEFLNSTQKFNNLFDLSLAPR